MLRAATRRQLCGCVALGALTFVYVREVFEEERVEAFFWCMLLAVAVQLLVLQVRLARCLLLCSWAAACDTPVLPGGWWLVLVLALQLGYLLTALALPAARSTGVRAVLPGLLLS